MDGIVPAELAVEEDMSPETLALLRECMDVEHQADMAVQAVTLQMQAEAVDRVVAKTMLVAVPEEEATWADMSHETFHFLHECMRVIRQADLAVYAVTERRFLAQSERVGREIDDMLAAPR